MKKSTKKLMALLLAILMLVALTACSEQKTETETPSSEQRAETAGSGSAKPEEANAVPEKSYTIGVAEAQAIEDVTIRHEYYEKYLGPLYNVKFIFSERLEDDNATKAFIENCIDMGADAIIDFKSCNSTMAKLCEENNLVYVINSVPRSTNYDLYEGVSSAFAGGVAGNMPVTGSYIADWLTENSSEDGSEGFLISSCMASTGVVEHIEITTRALEALQKKYGLTYTQEIGSIVMSPDPVIVENDKGINIYVYPGSPNRDTWLPGIVPLLTTGNYGFFISCAETYDTTANVVDEVERAKNIDIKVVSLGAMSSASLAFSNQDVHGNVSVDLVIATCSTAQSGTLFAVTYNALTNGVESQYIDGLPTYYTVNKLRLAGLGEAETLKGWDTMQTKNWIADQEFIDQLLIIKNPDLDPAGMKEFLASIDYDAIVEMISR